MGRNAGWLTAAAALAKGDDCSGCDAIYLPERVFDIDKFMEDVKKLAATKSSVVIAVSEGVKVADGRYVCEIGREVAVDAFGHKQMSGTAVMLAEKIAAETGRIDFAGRRSYVKGSNDMIARLGAVGVFAFAQE